jgi:predicted DNA-binding transcriptional regulator AlpA
VSSEDLVSTHDQSPRSIGSPRAPEDHSMTIAADSTAAAPVLLPLRTFLKQYSISKSSFYRKAAEMPPVIKIGRSTLVSVAEADAWVRSKLMPATALCGRP